MSSLVVDVMVLARAMRAERSLVAHAVGGYWRGCLMLTALVEEWSARRTVGNSRTLNFGCGNALMDDAVNADLFAPHRFLAGRRRPDLYWRGTKQLQTYEQYFRLIVCEHVIEHMLPDDVLKLLEGLYGVLAPGGDIVLSFPDVGTILEQAGRPGVATSAIELNSVIYRHGHRFMYDSILARDLLGAAGFEDIRSGTRSEMPRAERLLASRESQSVYVSARRPRPAVAPTQSDL